MNAEILRIMRYSDTLKPLDLSGNTYKRSICQCCGTSKYTKDGKMINDYGEPIPADSEEQWLKVVSYLPNSRGTKPQNSNIIRIAPIPKDELTALTFPQPEAPVDGIEIHDADMGVVSIVWNDR